MAGGAKDSPEHSEDKASSDKASSASEDQDPLVIRVGRRELIVRKRYEVLSIINDVMIALWFIVGSVLFFFEQYVLVGTVCFLLGSIELLIRPIIRLSRQIHLESITTTSAWHGWHDF